MATTKNETDDIRAELQAIRDDFAGLLKSVKELAQERADSALHSAKEAVDHAASRARATAGSARKQGEAFADEVGDMVVRHPVSAVLIALGVGYIVGRIRH